MRKKILILLVLLSVLSMAFGSGSIAASKEVSITLVNAEMISNDHVGNEWSYIAKIGKQEVEIGDSLSVSKDKKLTLYGKAVEADKYPDSGSKSVTITPSKYAGKEVKIKVTVTENRGRYSGNKAVWEFTFKVGK